MSPTSAFVTALFPSSAFAGSSILASARATCNVPKMAAEKPDHSSVSVSRRQALLAAGALLAGVPLSALAKSGDSPIISIFGVGGASSPFEAGVQTGGKQLYSELSEDELGVFKRIVDESKDRIIGAGDSIKAKSWEDIRSRCRLEAGELRKTTLRVNAGITDKTLAAKASKAATNIKLDLEQLDQACVEKNQESAFKKYNAVVKDIAEWSDVVGL